MHSTVLLIALLASCSAQAIIRPNGDRVLNVNVLSAGTTHVQPDGTVLMSGTAERAADHLAKYSAALLNTATVRRGLEAAQSITTKAIK